MPIPLTPVTHETICPSCNAPTDHDHIDDQNNWLTRFCTECQTEVETMQRKFAQQRSFATYLARLRDNLIHEIQPFTGEPATKWGPFTFPMVNANANYNLSQQARAAIKALKAIDNFIEATKFDWHETPYQTACRLAHRVDRPE